MKYTIQHGVERQFSERVNSNLHFILPLLVILAGVTFFLTNAQNGDHKPTKPLTLGIYTINSPDENKNGNPNGSNAGSGGNSAANNPPAPIAASELGTLAGAGNTGTAAGLPVGGRGSGDIQNAVTPPSNPITVTPPPAPTVVCTNLTATPVLCTACAPEFLLMAQKKAILASDGTCYAVDP